MIILALLMAAAPAATCDLSTVTSDRAAHDAFARRAVEIITLAAAGGTANEGRLGELIDPSAAFALGAGDVGVPLGNGVAGAIAITKRMNADQYRFLGWDYMEGPANGCGKGEIEVEFLAKHEGQVSQIKFTFEHGRVVAAKGWQRSYQTGPLAKPSGSQLPSSPAIPAFFNGNKIPRPPTSRSPLAIAAPPSARPDPRFPPA